MVEEENPTLTQILIVFTVANFVPLLISYLALGRPYFACNTIIENVGAIIIMTWNILLALWALIYWNHVSWSRIRDAFAWHMYGWRTVGWGIIGFILTLVDLFVVNLMFGPPFGYVQEWIPITSSNFLPRLALLLAYAVVIPLGEEIMFRGYIQTGIGRRYGPKEGLLLGASLFAFRHHPADLYFGWGALVNQLVSRLIQLYTGALIWGWIRHHSESTISTHIAHTFLLVFILILAFI